MIYLDNAATTKPSENVVKAMMPYMTEYFGNPASKYPLGRESRKAIDIARQRVAKTINAEPEQIIFTSGGSEGNSMVFAMLKHLLKDDMKGVVITNAEHESVTRAAEDFIQDQGDSEVLYLRVQNDCKVEPDDLEEILRRNKVLLVSAIYVNNETGAINPVKELAEICHKHGVLFHTDCVQALGALDIDVKEIGCDFATFSGHKIHGPKGSGALYIKEITPEMTALIKGTQENGLRGGTENVAGIVGFGQACKDLKVNESQFGVLQAAYRAGILFEMAKGGCSDRMIPTIKPEESCWKIVSLRIDGIDSETLISMVSDVVCISAGSACHEHEQTPSKVLLAMGLTEEQAYSTFRTSFSSDTTGKEAFEAGCIIGEAACELYRMRDQC